ncbi:hypothetical protein JTE78_23710, partial [Pseudomonas syringae pv. aptata]
FFTLLFWAIFKRFSAFRAVLHCSPREQKGNSGVRRRNSQPIGQCANGSFMHETGTIHHRVGMNECISMGFCTPVVRKLSALLKTGRLEHVLRYEG